MTDDKTCHVLSLLDIAAWQFPSLAKNCEDGRPPIIAAIPSLQRGAVWKPQQVELLWDSILRGFPVGALVVSKKLEKQQTRSGIYGAGWKPDQVTHHLLDGQQRCNAIALGFLDPFENADSNPQTTLWLDINPNSFFVPNSSRAFLLRLCSTAHPWGYDTHDTLNSKNTLSAEDIRKALERYDCKLLPGNDDYERPLPVNTWPYKAGIPIPLSWLLQCCENSQGTELWNNLRNRLEQYESKISNSQRNNKHWVYRALEFLQPLRQHEILSDFSHALKTAIHMQVVALTVSSDAITRATRQEVEIKEESVTEEQRIANVEHLFQRLNAGGTELRGDDLLYSMIKAYWPGIESTIELLKRKPPETQVALLGARVAISKDKPHGAINISQLRNIANPDGAIDRDKKLREEQLGEIKLMFGLLESLSENEREPIVLLMEKVDDWLLYNETENSFGLPPVLRAQLAARCPDVFFFLMLVAERALKNPIIENEEIFRRRLLGLVTALHWFGADERAARAAAVKKLLEMKPLSQWFQPQGFNGVLGELKKLEVDGRPHVSGIVQLCSPDELAALILEPNADTLQSWKWWNFFNMEPANGDNAMQDQRYAEFKPLFNKLSNRSSGEPLLIYGQRKLMDDVFKNYDTYISGYWDEHNRPWDYDHILPQNVFHRVKYASYLEVCQQWGNTIGNLHILRFEENRSRQDNSAKDSIPDKLLDLAWLRDDDGKDLRPAFSITRGDVAGGTDEKRDNVLGFVRAARTRLLRLYKEWYTQLDIEQML